jgi:uncharacterized membrane protein
MVEQSTVRTVVLGVVVFVALHTLVSSFATKSTASSKSKEGDEKVADEDSYNLKPWLDRVRIVSVLFCFMTISCHRHSAHFPLYLSTHIYYYNVFANLFYHFPFSGTPSASGFI